MIQSRCLQLPEGGAAQQAAAQRAGVPTLRTQRLCLRAATLGDFDLWSALMQGPDAPRLGGPLSEEQAYGAFCVYVAGWQLHGHGLWAVERSEDSALIGFVLVGLEWTDEAPELGWMLRADARGQGYATEAATAARDWGLDLLGAGQIVSYIDPDNTASARVAARLNGERSPREEASIGDGTQVWRYGGLQ